MEYIDSGLCEHKAEGGNSVSLVDRVLKSEELPIVEVRVCIKYGVFHIHWV